MWKIPCQNPTLPYKAFQHSQAMKWMLKLHHGPLFILVMLSRWLFFKNSTDQFWPFLDIFPPRVIYNKWKCPIENLQAMMWNSVMWNGFLSKRIESLCSHELEHLKPVPQNHRRSFNIKKWASVAYVWTRICVKNPMPIDIKGLVL